MADQAPAPTLLEMLAAMSVLIDGVLAVESGTWGPDMQADRDRARSIINRALDAGAL